MFLLCSMRCEEVCHSRWFLKHLLNSQISFRDSQPTLGSLVTFLISECGCYLQWFLIIIHGRFIVPLLCTKFTQQQKWFLSTFECMWENQTVSEKKKCIPHKCTHTHSPNLLFEDGVATHLTTIAQYKTHMHTQQHQPHNMHSTPLLRSFLAEISTAFVSSSLAFSSKFCAVSPLTL